MVSKYLVLNGNEKYILRITSQQDDSIIEVTPRVSRKELILLDEQGKIRNVTLQDGKCVITNFPIEKFTAAAVADGKQVLAKGELRKTDWSSVNIMLMSRTAINDELKTKEDKPIGNTDKNVQIKKETEKKPALKERRKEKTEIYDSTFFDILIKKWPNSKWEKIDYPGNPNRFYLTGEIYDEDGLMAVCYAVPGGTYMPYLGSSYYIEDDGNGYWLFFQDSDGEFLNGLLEG